MQFTPARLVYLTMIKYNSAVTFTNDQLLCNKTKNVEKIRLYQAGLGYTKI